jgi:hypothetical protein
VESQIDTQLVARIGPKIVVLAAQGRRSWDPAHLDIELLTSVPSVQKRLAELDTADQADPDAELNAIGDALEAAIKALPNPYREAALEHFGFTDQRSSSEPYSKVLREDRAAKKLGSGGRWYRKPHPKYFGMKPGDYVIALVACAFCGIASPIAYIARRESFDTNTMPNRSQVGHSESAEHTAGISNAASVISRALASPSATMVSRDPAHLEVFWVGPNNEVLYMWWLREQGWSREDSWTDPAAVSLTAVSRESGDEILFGLAPDGHVWYRIWRIDDRGWHTAGEVQSLGDDLVRGPLASASRGPDKLELFAFDLDGRPWHRWTEGGMNWSPWTYW